MSNPPVVLVTGHGSFPEALVESARMIGGSLETVHALGLAAGETPTDFSARMREIVNRVSPDIVLADLFGGTPHNVARVVLREYPTVPLMSSASLPLLLEIALGDAPFEAQKLDEVAMSVLPRIVSTTPKQL